ncbi:dapper homolog 3-like [Panicum virgatum]|uniref:dapper homolog 3-like n=1 Tax=Panicum virgatum TaxID=38727 RepID=UPI0019D68DDB|nr:dapper homolog 3-like [Panicum virgatum]
MHDRRVAGELPRTHDRCARLRMPRPRPTAARGSVNSSSSASRGRVLPPPTAPPAAVAPRHAHKLAAAVALVKLRRRPQFRRLRSRPGRCRHRARHHAAAPVRSLNGRRQSSAGAAGFTEMDPATTPSTQMARYHGRASSTCSLASRRWTPPPGLLPARAPCRPSTPRDLRLRAAKRARLRGSGPRRWLQHLPRLVPQGPPRRALPSAPCPDHPRRHAVLCAAGAALEAGGSQRPARGVWSSPASSRMRR